MVRVRLAVAVAADAQAVHHDGAREELTSQRFHLLLEEKTRPPGRAVQMIKPKKAGPRSPDGDVTAGGRDRRMVRHKPLAPATRSLCPSSSLSPGALSLSSSTMSGLRTSLSLEVCSLLRYSRGARQSLTSRSGSRRTLTARLTRARVASQKHARWTCSSTATSSGSTSPSR